MDGMCWSYDGTKAKSRLALCLALLFCTPGAHADPQARPAHPTVERAGSAAAKRAHPAVAGRGATGPEIKEVRPRFWDIGLPKPLIGRNPERITLAVIGKRFRPGATVLWNSQALRTRFRAAERLEAVVPFATLSKGAPRKPSKSLAPPSTAAWIRVHNPGPRSSQSNRVPFKVVFVFAGH